VDALGLRLVVVCGGPAVLVIGGVVLMLLLLLLLTVLVLELLLSKLSRRLLATSEGAGGVDDAGGGVGVAVAIAGRVVRVAIAVVVAAIAAGGVSVNDAGSGRAVPRRLGPWGKKNGVRKGVGCAGCEVRVAQGREGWPRYQGRCQLACPPPAAAPTSARCAPPWAMHKKEGTRSPRGVIGVAVVGI